LGYIRVKNHRLGFPSFLDHDILLLWIFSQVLSGSELTGHYSIFYDTHTGIWYATEWIFWASPLRLCAALCTSDQFCEIIFFHEPQHHFFGVPRHLESPFFPANDAPGHRHDRRPRGRPPPERRRHRGDPRVARQVRRGSEAEGGGKAREGQRHTVTAILFDRAQPRKEINRVVPSPGGDSD